MCLESSDQKLWWDIKFDESYTFFNWIFVYEKDFFINQFFITVVNVASIIVNQLKVFSFKHHFENRVCFLSNSQDLSADYDFVVNCFLLSHVIFSDVDWSENDRVITDQLRNHFLNYVILLWMIKAVFLIYINY